MFKDLGFGIMVSGFTVQGFGLQGFMASVFNSGLGFQSFGMIVPRQPPQGSHVDAGHLKP